MYKINGKQMFVETIELSGRSLFPKRISVRIDIDIVRIPATAALNRLSAAKNSLLKADDFNGPEFAEFKEAYNAMLDIILGEKNRKAIVKYFGDKYITMAAEITPFIEDVVMPALRAGFAKATRK